MVQSHHTADNDAITLIEAEMWSMEECVEGIKHLLPFNAIPFPPIPASCCSGFVLFDIARTAIVGHAKEILLFNKFLLHKLNDTAHSVSLESAGICHLEFCVNGSHYFPMADTFYGSEGHQCLLMTN